jgi:hypothetical protein
MSYTPISIKEILDPRKTYRDDEYVLLPNKNIEKMYDYYEKLLSKELPTDPAEIRRIVPTMRHIYDVGSQTFAGVSPSMSRGISTTPGGTGSLDPLPDYDPLKKFGLQNPFGAQCYFNAINQMMFRIPPFYYALDRFDPKILESFIEGTVTNLDKKTIRKDDLISITDVDAENTIIKNDLKKSNITHIADSDIINYYKEVFPNRKLIEFFPNIITNNITIITELKTIFKGMKEIKSNTTCSTSDPMNKILPLLFTKFAKQPPKGQQDSGEVFNTLFFRLLKLMKLDDLFTFKTQITKKCETGIARTDSEVLPFLKLVNFYIENYNSLSEMITPYLQEEKESFTKFENYTYDCKLNDIKIEYNLDDINKDENKYINSIFLEYVKYVCKEFIKKNYTSKLNDDQLNKIIYNETIKNDIDKIITAAKDKVNDVKKTTVDIKYEINENDTKKATKQEFYEINQLKLTKEAIYNSFKEIYEKIKDKKGPSEKTTMNLIDTNKSKYIFIQLVRENFDGSINNKKITINNYIEINRIKYYLQGACCKSGSVRGGHWIYLHFDEKGDGKYYLSDTTATNYVSSSKNTLETEGTFFVYRRSDIDPRTGESTTTGGSYSKTRSVPRILKTNKTRKHR